MAILALVAAIAVWLGYAIRAVQPESNLVGASNRGWLVGMVLVGCAVDALVAVTLLRGRIGIAGLMWLGLRVLLSIVGFLFLTIPLYAVAFLVLSRAPRMDPRTDPTLPHAYRPISAGWFGSLTPIWWSRTLVGASQIGETRCAVCREQKDDLIHGPAAA